jgi:hypothetical protein
MTRKLNIQPDALLPARKEGVVSRALGSRLVLYHPATPEVSVLNATAAAVWELCDGKSRVTDAVDALRARFRVPASHDLERDVAATLATLSGRGLLSVPDGGSPRDIR